MTLIDAAASCASSFGECLRPHFLPPHCREQALTLTLTLLSPSP